MRSFFPSLFFEILEIITKARLLYCLCLKAPVFFFMWKERWMHHICHWTNAFASSLKCQHNCFNRVNKGGGNVNSLIFVLKKQIFSKFHQFLVEVLDWAHHSDVRRQSWTCTAAVCGATEQLPCEVAAMPWNGWSACEMPNHTTPVLFTLTGSTISPPACRARQRLAPHLQVSFLLVQSASILCHISWSRNTMSLAFASQPSSKSC